MKEANFQPRITPMTRIETRIKLTESGGAIFNRTLSQRNNHQRRIGILRTRSSFRLKSTWYFRFAEFIQPLRGCGTSVCCWPWVSPAVIDFQALRAFPTNSVFFCLTYWAATKGCPYLSSCPDFFNREYQTLHAASLLVPLSTISSQLFTFRFSLPAH